MSISIDKSTTGQVGLISGGLLILTKLRHDLFGRFLLCGRPGDSNLPNLSSIAPAFSALKGIVDPELIRVVLLACCPFNDNMIKRALAIALKSLFTSLT